MDVRFDLDEAGGELDVCVCGATKAAGDHTLITVQWDHRSDQMGFVGVHLAQMFRKCSPESQGALMKMAHIKDEILIRF